MKITTQHQSFFISLSCMMLLFIAPTLLAAELTGPVFTTEPPHIDGKLDEGIWKNAFEINDFKLIDPDTGETPHLKTRFLFLYDKNNLYIGVINEQPEDTLTRRVTARDKYSQYVDRDQIEIALDPTAQGLYGYTFVVALGDSLTDGTIRPEREYSYNWDGPYRAATSSDSGAWYAEISIPWDIMEFPTKEGQRILGIYLQRDVANISERWGYPNIPKNSSIFLHNFAKMDVQDINPQGNLTLFPYASVGYDGVLGERTQAVGVDAFWQATSSTLLSATINPDFGDVENDQVEANFDSTQTLLQEKRTFFVEGNDIFETKGLNLVNTRRIGDDPDEPALISPPAPGVRERFVYKPQITDILGAVKVTGSENKFRYGVLTAFEGDTEFQTDFNRRPEAEGRNYYTARALFENNSRKSDYIAMGYLGTYVQHDIYDAMVNSVDAQWLTANQKIRLEGQIAVSDINIDNNQGFIAYSDGTEVNDGTGYAYNGKFIYYPTKSSWFSSQFDLMDSKFNLNDFGYSPRLDRLNFNNEYFNNLSNIKGTKWARYSLYARGDYNNGNLLKTDIGFSSFAQLNNLQKAFIQAYYTPKAWDDVATYQQEAFRTKEGWFLWLSWFSDESKPFYVYLNPRYYTEKTGGITKYYRGRIRYTPFDRLTFETELTYWNKQHWIVGRRSDTRVDAFNADQFQYTFSSNYKLTSKHELRLQIQWLGIDAEDKVSYDIATDGHLYRTYLETSRPRNFGYSQFIGQIRYKYEFAPLSDLFVVYNRGGLATPAFDSWDDLIFDGWDKRDVDKFLVKIRYRF